jgi:cytochrome c oxidase subunit 4
MSTPMSAEEHAVEPAADHGEVHAHAHPSDIQYVYIALFLALVTAAEVAVYYVKALKGLLVYILVVMAVVKFSVVVMFFMHLRFDSKLFRRLFITGIILAMFCYVSVLSTFHIWHR